MQFRKWATRVVEEFAIKGFAMDDERLKRGGSVLSDRYFEEQLQRVREIRLSEALHDIVRALDDIRLPVDAHVIGEPVTVVRLFRHDDGARAGLRAVCERLGISYEVSLADVVFATGSPADALVTQYRTWLGLTLHGSVTRNHRPHKVGDGEIAIGSPTDLVVLACRSNALHCRLLEGSRAITLRTPVRDDLVCRRLRQRVEEHAERHRMGGIPMSVDNETMTGVAS